MYDYVIVGYGVATCFFVEQLLSSERGVRILVVEKGKNLGGLLKSECKFNFDTSFGGDFSAFINEKELFNCFDTIKQILDKVEPANIYRTRFEGVNIENIEISEHETYHLGHAKGAQLIEYFDHQRNHVDCIFDTEVIDYSFSKQSLELITRRGTLLFKTQKLILAANSNKLVSRLELSPASQFQYGLRLETASALFDKLLKDNMEIKFTYDQLQSHCFNHHGYVCAKVIDGYYYPDGVNQRERSIGSDKTNFSLFLNTSKSQDEIKKFLSDYSSLYAESQELVKFKLKEVINNNLLGVEYSQQLLAFLPSFAELLTLAKEDILNWDGYLFDYKIKAPRLSLNEQFMTSAQDVYAIGDITGYSSSLSYAAVNGILLADILTRNK